MCAGRAVTALVRLQVQADLAAMLSLRRQPLPSDPHLWMDLFVKRDGACLDPLAHPLQSAKVWVNILHPPTGARR